MSFSSCVTLVKSLHLSEPQPVLSANVLRSKGPREDQRRKSS